MLVTITMVKFELIPIFYTSIILLINQSKEISEKQFSVVFFAQEGPNKPFNVRTPFCTYRICLQMLT